MYVMQGGEGARRDPTGGAASVLERTVAMTGLSCAFIAVEQQARGRSILSIRARFANAPQRSRWRLPETMRQALQSAIESASPVIIIGKRKSRAVGVPPVLIAAPLMSDGRCFGALAGIGYIPAPYVKTLRSIRRLASMLDVGELVVDAATDLPEKFLRAASARQDMLLHELRVPLSAAALLLESLTSQPARKSSAAGEDDRLHSAIQAVQEAQSLIRHFSQLQALDQGNLPITLRPIQVQPIIERAIALLPGSMGSLRRIAPVDPPEVVADPLWLTHILTNLLENARTHSPAPHAVDVTTALSPDHRRIMISITSYGAGIPAAEQAAMFRPYQRRLSRDDLTSKGLGLSIAKYLVTEMRGDLRVESDGLHSATFRVTLPIAFPSAR